MNSTEKMLLGAAVGAVLCLIAYAVHDHYWWKGYSVKHHCVATGKTREETTQQIYTDSKGNISMIVPQVTTYYEYQCDNNEFHWR